MKKLIVHFTFIVLVISMVFISGASAATKACDGSLADCQSKVNASADGDIITIPNGSFRWDSALSVGLSGGRALTIKGLNACTLDANGRPTSCPTSISGTGGFSITGSYGKAWSLNNLTLNGGIGINIAGSNNSWRIHHIYFNAPTPPTVSSSRIIFIRATGSNTAVQYGLIDHVTVYDSTAVFMAHMGNWDTGGNYDWSLGPELGTANAVYVEDSTFVTPTYSFYGSYINDCTTGGSDVIRHNILGAAEIQNHDAIIVGMRGCKKVEFYDNSITNVAGIWSNDTVRGGAHVMFNNTITNAPDGPALQLALYRTYQTGGDPWQPRCGTDSGKAILDSVTTYPVTCTSGTGCVNIDGAGTGGYPCRDQLGTAGNGVQTIVPALFWNNKVDGSYVEPVIINGAAYYTKGIDYCSNASATKPTTCNGSAVTYTPYTYPHPLSSSAPPSRPGPPQKLRIGQ